MQSGELQAKWTAAREDADLMIPGLESASSDSFVMLFGDAGGAGPCAVDITVGVVMDDLADCMAHLRFYVLEEYKDWAVRMGGEPVDTADLEGELEQAIAAGVSDPADMEQWRVAFNERLATTNPSYAVHAWGTMAEVATSAYALEAAQDFDDEELIERLNAGLGDGDDDYEIALEVVDALQNY